MSNLLANAVRHGTGGPVRVVLDGRSPQGVMLEVTNPGEIDPAIVPFIFDPFRAGRERKDRDGGLGLGLYIVQQIVKGHGGTIEVRSNPERGTSFQVWLPRRDIGEAAVSA
jgi:signal transduction histidine kinase